MNKMNIGHPAQNKQKQKIATSYNMMKGSFLVDQGVFRRSPEQKQNGLQLYIYMIPEETVQRMKGI